MHRTQRALKERDFLVKLRDINEEFLKNMLNLERRNIDLEEQLERAIATSDPAARVEIPASVGR